MQVQSHSEDVHMRKPGEGDSRAALAVSEGPTAILQRPSSSAAMQSGALQLILPTILQHLHPISRQLHPHLLTVCNMRNIR